MPLGLEVKFSYKLRHVSPTNETYSGDSSTSILMWMIMMMQKDFMNLQNMETNVPARHFMRIYP